ncbi:DUF2065 domain-containing protein [Halochromatium glycolicum]|jgi:uncharacterized protein YjeT (DUF2065 family)|uniref:DUF2065 domain-containing protein n=1 Tax=Halochromatium glycolicum TaxID=85075 RepID=A0AAJ0U502_9GAMM|nr:DUF2065 domain-containing protein [Halochromatium glycolicum]MBK1705384.1 DUF2065 domain-containing protein [Halochromatium glycolicum]NBC48528.1 DUF2065 family protein [Gammaproteobacteria bacterium]
MWHALLLALSLMLVIEGLMPFIAPNLFRRLLLQVASQEARELRVAGLVSMLSGVALLYLIN